MDFQKSVCYCSARMASKTGTQVFDMGIVLIDWRGACIVPLYKRKGDKCECSNSRGISLLSVVGKLHGRVLI